MSYVRISDALRELVFDRRLTVEDALDKYFAADYSHRNGGIRLTRAEFAAMATGAREEIAHGTTTVLDEFRVGDRYSERHVLDVVKKDGSTERAEIYIIGRYANDGRFASLNEAGFPLPGDVRSAAAR
jgi:hypothetical protein